MKNEIKKVLEIAALQKGVKEDPPGSNLQKFGSWYEMNGVPWCAIFVSWVFNKAGVNLPIQTEKGFHYVPSAVNWFKSVNRFFQEPEPGDVVFFDFNKDGISEHVGIVDQITHHDTFLTWEGNTSLTDQDNGGAVMHRKRYKSQVLGFGRPLLTDPDYVGHWAEKTIIQAMDRGIMSGFPDGNFKPDEPLTRAQAAIISNFLYSKIEGG